VTRDRIAGSLLLISIPVWWQGLHAWARSRYGYLDPEVHGLSPFLWIMMVLIVALALLLRLIPRHRNNPAIALGTFGVFSGLLAVNNLIAGVQDGLSEPGAVLGFLSVAQFIVGVVGIAAVASPAPRRPRVSP
jgi:hypothetical protein